MDASDTLAARYGALDVAQAQALDAAADELGTGVQRLMEIAGWQVARWVWRMIDRSPASLVVLAGHGNNGGDALSAARHLTDWGCRTSVGVISERALTGLAAVQLGVLRTTAAEVVMLSNPIDVRRLSLARDRATVVVDGLLGTGIHSPPRESVAAAIRLIDGGPVLSIDVPSGLHADTGEPFIPCVHATATCCLGAVKRGLWGVTARSMVGKLWVADIGIPRAAWERCALSPPTAVGGGALEAVD